jgi:pyruvate/2-oxoglutarate dehydrogenase complex dihydrolipoamide acyltransferase (E2) component
MNDKIISLKQEADVVYGIMDKQQVDYDTFKQVADASASMTTQAKKVYDRLYNTFIQYPFFVRSLEGVYLESKLESDKDAKLLQQKLDVINVYKSKYESIINEISELEIENDIAELAAQVQDLANNPDSLVYSYELVDAADAAARAAIQAEIQENTRTGTEVCIDKEGNIVDMSICRPSYSSTAGGGAYSGAYTPSASEIAAKGIDDWIEIVNAAAKKEVKDVLEAAKKSDVAYNEAKSAADKVAAEKAAAQKAESDKIAAEKAAAEKAEADRIEAERVAALTAAEKAAEEAAKAAAAEKEAAEKAEAEKARLEKMVADQKAAVIAAEKAAAEKALKLDTESKSIANSFKFKVDLSKITQDKKLLDQTAPSPRQQNINFALCNSKKVSTIIENYITIGSAINDWRYLYDGLVNTNTALAINVRPVNANYLEVGRKVRIFKSDNIYFTAVVSMPYVASEAGGVLFVKITKVVGNGTFNGFSIQAFDSINESLKFIINNPSSTYNGALLTDYLNDISATDEEISIARASCPDSDFSSEYYTIYNYKGSWNQYQRFAINDVVNYNGRSYLVIRTIDGSVYYYNPEQLNTHYKPFTTQFFINNAYCNLINGLVLNSVWGVFWNDASPTSGNGATWEEFKKTYNVTDAQEKIAMASCTKTSSFASFDGKTKKMDLTPLLVGLSAISILYIMHNILKKDK